MHTHSQGDRQQPPRIKGRLHGRVHDAFTIGLTAQFCGTGDSLIAQSCDHRLAKQELLPPRKNTICAAPLDFLAMRLQLFLRTRPGSLPAALVPPSRQPSFPSCDPTAWKVWPTVLALAWPQCCSDNGLLTVPPKLGGLCWDVMGTSSLPSASKRPAENEIGGRDLCCTKLRSVCISIRGCRKKTCHARTAAD